MQLIQHSPTILSKKSTDIGIALAAATCTLLGGAPAHADKGDPGSWSVSTAVLYYGEGDGRVQAVEPVISATRYMENNKSLNFKFVLDTLTGASPSGATPSDQVQTYTKPSGKGSYEVSAGENPLDDTFRDTRVALSAAWNAEFNRDWTYSAAMYGSNEHDYQSFGLSGTLSRYFNQKNTQLNFGLAFSSDTISPEGGVPVGLSRHALQDMTNFESVWTASRGSESDTKSIMDVVIGFSQIVSKRTVMQLNYSLSQSDGYLTDPYKILSVIDDNPGINYGNNALDQDNLSIFVYENRPDTRTKHALYWQLKTMLGNGSVIDTSYRFMTDDWGIQSHTFDLRYRWQFASSYLEPHIRYYTQSDADFYRRFVNLSEYQENFEKSPELSSDYRLGELDAFTIGLKYGRKVFANHEFYARAEYYMQTNSGDSGYGQLRDQDLYFDTNAFMFTLGYSF